MSELYTKMRFSLTLMSFAYSRAALASFVSIWGVNCGGGRFYPPVGTSSPLAPTFFGHPSTIAPPIVHLPSPLTPTHLYGSALFSSLKNANIKLYFNTAFDRFQREAIAIFWVGIFWIGYFWLVFGFAHWLSLFPVHVYVSWGPPKVLEGRRLALHFTPVSKYCEWVVDLT